MSRAEELDRFVEFSEWIRELSSPQVEGVHTPEDYRKRFVRNFARIYELSRSCREILEREVFPLLEKEAPLTEEETEDLFHFVARLLDAVYIECVDVPLRDRVTGRLIRDAEEKNDIRLLLRALDARVENSYYMMVAVSRIAEVQDVFSAFRDKGMEASDRILALLDKEQFASLPDYASKEIVLVNARYVHALYEDAFFPVREEVSRANMAAMKRALELADDPFFIDQASKYNWKYHIFRAFQGIAFMTDYVNMCGVPDDLLPEINRYTRQMVAFWKRDKVTYGALCAPELLNQSMYRNAYLAGEISVERFREEIVSLVDNADPEDFSHDGNMNTIFCQTEYLLTLDKDNLTDEQKAVVTRFYRKLVKYVHRMPKLGSLTFLLMYLKRALDAFIEFEGGPDYEALLLEMLASILPQTYMHSLGVADLARILAEYLFLREPERFAKVPGCPDKEAVADFCYHAGLLHDVGKLMVAECILTYNRDWFDEEQVIYATGPEIGAKMLEHTESTRPYAEAVRTHHYAFDRSDSFAKLYDGGAEAEQAQVVPHILRLANDLRWMTTEIRFSSAVQLDYDSFLERAEKESGTTYAPYVVALLKDKDCASRLREALEKEVTESYRKTYELLKAIAE